MKCNAAPYDGNKNYIFISYSHEDESRVYPYIELMARDGYRVWFDEGIIPGDEWQETIARHLEMCDVFVAFITEKSIASHNCRSEINYAVRKNKTIISLFLDDVVLSPGMEMILSNIQGIYRSGFTSAGECLSKLYESAEVDQCRGSFRPDIIINPFNDAEELESDKTLTLTIGAAEDKYSLKKSYLYRISNKEKIDIERATLSLGRSKDHADYVIDGNKTISRNHATVKGIHGHYTIVDNDSLNHTLLNGQVIEPWAEYELACGDTVSLGMELFLFFKDYDEANTFRMPEHVLVRNGEEIRVPNKPVSTVGSVTIVNTGRAYYLVNTSADDTIIHNGMRLYYGEKIRLQNEDEIISGTEQYIWRILL